MNCSIVPLSRLPASGLPALASLHCATMPTLLADLGMPVVLRYYQTAQKDASVVGECALSPSGEMLGWALGSPAPAALNARLRQPLTWFAGQLLRLAFTRPRTIVQLAQSAFSASDINTIQRGQIELTYIGVSPAARGQGLGQSLLSAFMDAARAAAYLSVVLSVETDNPSALALYKKQGFQITSTFVEGRYHRHRMECAL